MVWSLSVERVGPVLDELRGGLPDAASADGAGHAGLPGQPALLHLGPLGSPGALQRHLWDRPRRPQAQLPQRPVKLLSCHSIMAHTSNGMPGRVGLAARAQRARKSRAVALPATFCRLGARGQSAQ